MKAVDQQRWTRRRAWEIVKLHPIIVSIESVSFGRHARRQGRRTRRVESIQAVQYSLERAWSSSRTASSTFEMVEKTQKAGAEVWRLDGNGSKGLHKRKQIRNGIFPDDLCLKRRLGVIVDLFRPLLCSVRFSTSFSTIYTPNFRINVPSNKWETEYSYDITLMRHLSFPFQDFGHS